MQQERTLEDTRNGYLAKLAQRDFKHAIGSETRVWSYCKRDIVGTDSIAKATRSYAWWMKAYDKLDSAKNKDEAQHEILTSLD